IKPMHVEIDGMGRYRKVQTVQELADMLMSGSWHHHGGKFHRALSTSIRALELHSNAHTARSAFVDAAHEAGMRILPDDMP
ncbi:DUF982 domain-containing protein, partial [Rhizobium grahamii]